MGTSAIHNDDESTTPLLNDNPPAGQGIVAHDQHTSVHTYHPLGTTPDPYTQRNDSPPSHSLPSTNTHIKSAVIEAATTTAPITIANDDQKYCRICGEGEEDEEDQDADDSCYSNNGQAYDEESLINDPRMPSTTMITQQEPPGIGYTQMMARYQSNNGTQDERLDTALQHEQHASVSATSATTTPRHGIHTKKWIRQSNPLIRPCRCKGTMMYVHVSCLNRWRVLSPRASSYVACDLCGYEYNIYRPRYAAIVTNVHFLRLMTAFLVILFIIMCAYLVKTIDVYGLGHRPHPDDETWLELHGPTWLWMDRFYLFVGLVVVSLLGMGYLVFLCMARPDQLAYLVNPSLGAGTIHTANGGGSCLCCDQSSCPWYSCYLADFAACSGDAAAGGFLIFVVLMSLLAILFGVLGAVTGVFRLMESLVDRVAGHIKEKILDVD